MTDSLEEFERRLAEQLGELADTPLPGRRTVDDVTASAIGFPQPRRRWLLPVAAIVALGAVATTLVVGPRIDRGFGDNAATATLTAPSAPAVNDPMPFVTLLGVLVYDYEPVDSPEALADNSDLVVVGHVRSMTAEAAQRGTTMEAVLAVEVSELVRGDPALLTSGIVYVSAQMAPADDVESLLPTGRMLLFLSQTGDLPGRPDDTNLYRPFPQGFWIESPGGMVGAYAQSPQGLPNWDANTSLDDLIGAARD